MLLTTRSTKNRIPLNFNGFPMPLIVNICKVAQDILGGDHPTPFVKKTNFGCQADFESKEMVEQVQQILNDVVTHDFPISSTRIIYVCFHIAIEDDEPESFIYHFENNTFFICHPTEGYSDEIIRRMKEIYEKHMFPHSILLISDLVAELSADDYLMIPCELQTFLLPMIDKEEEFFKEFHRKLERLKTITVDYDRITFDEVKSICKDITLKGVFYRIKVNMIELTGLPFNLKNFSEILKRRIREKQTRTHVLSRK